MQADDRDPAHRRVRAHSQQDGLENAFQGM
jgi:hypothetical protein